MKHISLSGMFTCALLALVGLGGALNSTCWQERLAAQSTIHVALTDGNVCVA